MPTIDLNLMIKAPTQYTNIPFNSYANFNGISLGASSSGLCQMCCGNTDNDDAIQSNATLFKTDFGIKNPKRVRYIYVGFKADSPVTMTVTVDNHSVRTYELPVTFSGHQRIRVPVDRNSRQKGRYWQFAFSDSEGAMYTIDSVDVMFVVLSEGFK